MLSNAKLSNNSHSPFLPMIENKVKVRCHLIRLFIEQPVLAESSVSDGETEAIAEPNTDNQQGENSPLE
jgi:hypothetical protein